MTQKLKLGILTWRNGRAIEEIAFFTRLAHEAAHLETEVFLFSPRDILPSGKFKGLVYHPVQGWKETHTYQPDIVYDRFRNMKQPAFHQFIEFRNHSKLTFLNSRTAHKWNLHKLLKEHPQISAWLPNTVFYHSVEDVLELLRKFRHVYVKPVNGTGGKGILRIEKDGTHFHASGREKSQKEISKHFSSMTSLQHFLADWTYGVKHIVQQGLDLEWEKGHVTDFRLLVQKDGSGKWGITGLVGKVGKKDHITSNLHSGGSAVDPKTFLLRFLPEERCQQLLEECKRLGLLTAEFLESKFGRLAELGIDLGIDKNANIWLIEVNPKPGRDLFLRVGNMKAFHQAIRNPIEYARFLVERKGKS